MSLPARDLFILMDSAIIWIYFRNSHTPICLTATASLFRDTLAITLTNLLKQNQQLFHQISFKGHLMWILLPRRHLLLLSLVVLVAVVVAVVMAVVVIVQVAVVVVVKSWPELVNNKLEARASKYKFGPRTAKHKFGARAGKHIFGARAVKYKSGTMAGKYKLGARTRAGGQAKDRGPGNTNTQHITSYSGRKFKATRLLKLLPYFFKWLQCVVLGELRAPNALQYRFKIFSGATRINADKNGICFFSNYL